MIEKNNDTKSNNFTVIIILSLILLFILLALIGGSSFTDNIINFEDMLFDKFYFLFFLVLNIVIIGLIILAFSKYGKVKIGGKNSTIEHSNFSWYAMLFSAGMGIGIMFYAVAEPLAHSKVNPLFNSNSIISSSLATTYFSWGIHAWAIYVLVGLAFAFFAYNKKLPLSFRSLFYPILKDKIFGKIGDVIDAIGAIVTLFALASSLALGAMQINSGLNFLIDLKISTQIQVMIIIVVIIAATISVVSGLDKGIKILSKLNIYLAFILALFLFILGPSFLIIKNFIFSSFIYIKDLIPASIAVNHVDLSWSKDWTIFYMAWWISWSIFVGIFIAKISKGRTVKEFILSILIIPTILIILWFSILGTDSIFVDSANALSQIVDKDVSLSLFGMISLLINSHLIKVLLELLALIIIILFFVTSSDSGSLVVGFLANRGENLTTYKKIFWSVMQCLIAITIIIIGGVRGIDLIQALLIIISLPLTIFLLYILITLIKELKEYYNSEYK